MTVQLTPKDPAPQDWIDALEQARDDVAAGRTVPASAVHALLRDSIAESQRDEAAAARKNPIHRR